MTREDILDLIPAYALDALDTIERAEVDALLKDDAEAQQLLADYTAIALSLVLHVPERPAPDHLRTDLQARLAARKTIAITDAKSGSKDTGITPQDTSSTGKNPLSLTWLSLVAAIVAVVIGITLFVPRTTSPATSPGQVLYDRLTSQETVLRHSITPEAADDVVGELVVSNTQEQAVLRIASLPDTTTDESYQLWLITGEGVHNGGIFHWETGHGPYFVEITPDVLDKLVAIGMTIEPFAGSPLGDEPTGERLFAVEVAAAN